MKLPRGSVACCSPGSCFCNGRRYTCKRCKRFVPECFGADDAYPEVCDDCAFQLLKGNAPDHDLWYRPPQPVVRNAC